MKKGFITLLAAITIASVGVSITNNGEPVQAKTVRRAKHHKSRRHTRRHVRKSKRRSNRRRSKRHARKRPRKRTRKTTTPKVKKWWENLPEPNFTSNNESMFGKIHEALAATGDQRKADEYAIMKQEGLVYSSGQPSVSLSSFESQIKSMDADVSGISNSILHG